MKIIVGSTSDRKIKVVERIFKKYFDKNFSIKGHSALSGVPETPYDKQTFDGAKNRAVDCKKNHKADYYAGLESGLVERYGEIYEEAWACIIDKEGKEYFGYSSGLKLPKYVLQKMKDLDLEHCDAMTIIEKELGSLPNDTWGTYSGGQLIRELSLEEALRNALVQLLPQKTSLYKER